MSNDSIEISRLIAAFKQQPLQPLELQLLLEKLSDENASVMDFKEQYARDPLLCSYLVDIAWEKTKKKANHPFAADHAMSAIGIDGARTFISSLSTDLKKQSHLVLTDELRFIMTSSLLAAEIAKHLCHDSSKSNHLYWASLAHQFPETILWHIKQKPMWRVRYRQIKLPKKLALFEQAKLGFELTQWRQSVATEWHMSELNQLIYKKNYPDKRKELLSYAQHGYGKSTPSLKTWHLTEAWQVLTANWLARALLLPWFGNRIRHYSQIAMHAFSATDRTLKKAVNDSVRVTSQNLFHSELLVPAQSLLYLRSKPDYPYWLNAAAKKPMVRQKKFVEQGRQLKESSKQLTIQKFLRELKDTPEKFNNPNKLLRQTLQLCIDRIDFSRACLLVVDWKAKQVSTGLYIQRQNSSAIKIEFKFSQKTPFNKFLKEQGFLFFDKKMHSKIWSRLPEEIIRQKIEQFVLFSFKSKERINSLVYLDSKGMNAPTPERIKATRSLLTAIGKHLSS